MTQSDKTNVSLLVHQLQAEHVELRELLEEVHDRFAACHRKSGAARTQCLAKSVRQLQEYIEAHFAREEQGGWLEEAVVRAPHLAHRLTLLEREHIPLRKQIAQLAELVSCDDCTADRLAQFQREFDQFVVRLRQHEADEERVLAEGFNEDLEIG